MNRTSLSSLVTSLVICAAGIPVLYSVSKQALVTRRVSAARTQSISVFYAPSENLEAIDIETLSRARVSIELAAYSLTDQRIIQTLTTAARSGVIVTVYLDRGETNSELRRPELAAALRTLAETPNATVRVKGRSMLQHMKAYVVDTHVLRTGSANFSRQAELEQDNDLVLAEDEPTIEVFERNFQSLIGRGDSVLLKNIAPQP